MEANRRFFQHCVGKRSAPGVVAVGNDSRPLALLVNHGNATLGPYQPVTFGSQPARARLAPLWVGDTLTALMPSVEEPEPSGAAATGVDSLGRKLRAALPQPLAPGSNAFFRGEPHPRPEGGS
jgi:hypothetical protein